MLLIIYVISKGISANYDIYYCRCLQMSLVANCHIAMRRARSGEREICKAGPERRCVLSDAEEPFLRNTGTSGNGLGAMAGGRYGRKCPYAKCILRCDNLKKYMEHEINV